RIVRLVLVEAGQVGAVAAHGAPPERVMTRGLNRALKQTLSKQVTYRLNHGTRRLARQEMAGDGNHTPLVACGEVTGMPFRQFRRPNPIAGTVQHDRWHGDRRLFSKALLQRLQCRVAWRVAVAVPI